VVFVGLSYSALFNPVLLEEPSFFDFLWIFFLFKLFRRSFFWILLLIFFFLLSFIRRRNNCLGSFWGSFFVLGLSIVQFLLKFANISEQGLHGTIYLCLFLLFFFFSWILESCLLILTLRYAVFLLGFCSLFLLRGFGLVYLFERWQHSSFSSTRTFFESHLKFSSPHMLQPNCRGNDWSES